jgi:hypothetical protein
MRARGFLCDSSGHITSCEIRTLRTEFPEYELRAYLQKRNDWSDDVYDSISWRAYGSASAGLTDSLLIFVVKLSNGWLPIGVRERRCRATTDVCPQCNEIETVPHLYRRQARAPWRHRFLIHLHGHLKENDTAADIRCIIIKGIENWFLTGGTNDPDSIDTVVETGWFQVLKGYIPKEWTSSKRSSKGADATTQSTTQASSGRKNLLTSSGRTATPSGKTGAQSHTHLEKAAQTTLALAPDKRHTNVWKRHTHSLSSC